MMTSKTNSKTFEGQKVLGGGYEVDTPMFMKVFSSLPSDGKWNIVNTGWNIFVHNEDQKNARRDTVVAVCAEISELPVPFVRPLAETIEFPFDRQRLRISAAQLLSANPTPDKAPFDAFDWTNPVFGSVIGKNCNGDERRTVLVLYPRKDSTSFVYQVVQMLGTHSPSSAGGPGRFKKMRTYEQYLSGYRDEWPEDCANPSK